MNEIFVPSLLISLGPCGRKALEFSKELLSYIPEHFLKVIDYYCIEELEGIAQHIQDIIDNKLLSVKNLNKLLDFGYKVRNDNVSSVRINIYLLWDVYDCNYSAYEVVRTLAELNYGNLDKDRHCGMTLYIFPIMEKEWLLEEAESRASLNKVKEVIDFLSLKENILYMDSKVFVLHCVSDDGTRIPIDELQYIGGLIVYLNIIPSKDPPLSHYKRRILMEEGRYKLGTIGINSLMIFKDRLLEEYSIYMAADTLKYALEQESDDNYEAFLSNHLLEHTTQKKMLSHSIDIIKEGAYYSLNNLDEFDEILGKEIEIYPKKFMELEQFILHQYLPKMKDTVDKNSEAYTLELKENIENDLSRIAFNQGLKESLKYLSVLKEKLTVIPSMNKAKLNVDTSELNAKLEEKVNKIPNLVGFIIKSAILSIFLLYLTVKMAFSSTIPGIMISVTIFAALFIFLYLDYFYAPMKLNSYIDIYKKELLKKYGEEINDYIEEKIVDNQAILERYLEQKIFVIESCIEHCKKVYEELCPINEKEDKGFGNLIVNLLDSQDRHKFYLERSPRASDVYKKFTADLVSLEDFLSEKLKEKIAEFSLKISATYVDIDSFEYLKFKYKEKTVEELGRWFEKGIIKSTYLLQYIHSDLMEEYSLLIGSSEVNRVIKDMDVRDIADCELLMEEEKNHYINSISLIRVCLGVDFENIAPVKIVKKGDRNA
ncbi:hypothetical protein [Clostridium thermarum]|uniref:hypothetical protein n=1 Tax=Clostridium thermarum TaxID=1716543 RepID=UPI0011203C39|nr:hypothetical protein [Clostridium thermarum]